MLNFVGARQRLGLTLTGALLGMALSAGEASAGGSYNGLPFFTTSWAPSGVHTDSQGLAYVEAAGVLYGFYRGDDGLLNLTYDKYDYNTGGSIGTTYAVGSSPLITTDGPSAAYDSSTGTVFVAVRTQSGRVQVGEGAADTDGISSWKWTDLGSTDASPAIAVACNHVHVAVSAGSGGSANAAADTTVGGHSAMGGRVGGNVAFIGGGAAIWTIQRAASGDKWSSWSRLVSTRGLPSLAVNSRGEVGLAARGSDSHVIFSKMPCDASTTAVFGPPVTVGDLSTSDARVGLTAYGPYFAAAIRAKNGYPYFLLQTPGPGPAVWPASFEPVDASWRSPFFPVAEPPVAVTFRGLIFLTARDLSNNLYYWIRNPNTLAPLAAPPEAAPRPTMWTGGRIVGGGVGTTPATLAPAGTRQLESRFASQVSAPAELFIAMRGADNKEIWALNMSRFATFDILEDVYQMTVDTTTGFPIGPNNGLVVVGNGVPENKVLNIFENLETFLRTPSKYWDSLSDVKNGGKQNCSCPGGTGITIYPNLFNESEWVDGQCKRKPPIASGVVVDGEDGTAWTLWEEFGHEVLGMNRAGTTNDSSWKAAFRVTKPKTCNKLPTDCDPYNYCVRAIDAFPKDPNGNDSEVVKKVGAGTKVCASLNSSSPWRPSGFTDDYALNSDEHNWIDTMLVYRWFGDDLRAMADGDAASGDTRLLTKYIYIRDKMFDGVEFNGSRGNASAIGDETRGGFAMPLR